MNLQQVRFGSFLNGYCFITSVCSFDRLPPVSHGSRIETEIARILMYQTFSAGLLAGEERPEHRNQNQGDNEADDYQTGAAFYVVHEGKFAGT